MALRASGCGQSHFKISAWAQKIRPLPHHLQDVQYERGMWRSLEWGVMQSPRPERWSRVASFSAWCNGMYTGLFESGGIGGDGKTQEEIGDLIRLHSHFALFLPATTASASFQFTIGSNWPGRTH
ncbi:hypothetical protein K438DRAFT_1775647 [Mycena galopus ATCC 62051]|nr:hypothetical protein K438DRAFT_1775647 [Mycena galopus ATCC 62051]